VRAIGRFLGASSSQLPSYSSSDRQSSAGAHPGRIRAVGKLVTARFRVSKEHKAASLIQARYRGRMARQQSSARASKQTKANVSFSQIGYFTHWRGETWRMRLERIFSRDAFIRAPLWLFVCSFLLINMVVVAAFAVLFYLCGQQCFVLGGNEAFTLHQMLWLSVHTFTTVGYGGHAPTGACTGPQLLVFLEHFVGLLDVGIFTAMLLTKVMMPYSRSAVRFSDKFLIGDEPDPEQGDKPEPDRWLSFRLVRLVPQQLRDAELRVWCGILSYGSDGVVRSCAEYALPLENSRVSNLDSWIARHRIDADSPLHHERFKDLAFVNVTLTAYDTAHMQETRVYHSYTPFRDMVRDARFAPMKTWEAVALTSKPDVLEVTRRAFGHAPRAPSQSASDVAADSSADEELGGEQSSIRELHHHIDMSKLNAYSLVLPKDRGRKSAAAAGQPKGKQSTIQHVSF